MMFRVPYCRFMNLSKSGLIFSIIFSAFCLGLILFRGFNFGLEFTGGSTIEIQYPNPVKIEDIREIVKTIHPRASVLQYGSSRDIQIRFAELKNISSGELNKSIITALKKHQPKLILLGQSRIDGQYKSELVEKGILALFFSSLGIMIYLSLRFEWKFALGAVLAQLHDILATAALFSLTQWTFDLTVLAGLLAVLGYSVNDTVVVFDRIRENFINQSIDKPTNEVIDQSINQTLVRTLVTSLTTLLAVVTLLFFGGETLFGFAAALIFGIFFGTYSSIFVASSIVYRMGVSATDLLPKSKKMVDELP